MVWLSPLILLANTSVALQVLGSGGPESGDKRASTAYIIWIDGKSRILIDFGGGASLRFEEVNANIADLDVILLTHLHVDHTADLPALLKSSFFTHASGKLHIFGPDKNIFMPSTDDFIERLFKNAKGAWQYLGDHLDGQARLQLKTHNIRKNHKASLIYKNGSMTIQAISVHHGPIPAIAYRVNIGNKSITFSGDMSGQYHTLETLAKNTNILVAHNAVPQNASGVATQLHMKPSTIGQIAQKATPKKLILSHRMLRTLGKEKETKREIRKYYKGPIQFANDKSYYKVR
ncbi:MAG: MBL fold metallo-hydrolase [uncultured Sulfurovum sp.]|uniref:MBL fold metallo-hydrolase n=1 Tax=uncultured Sulfurovum sp. TaxID=269237 RepID=A0A6S6SKL4_9BACT|nr:MAG: MBL fold metallo-hydrolase [uncultured Sulfurovum sp.]